MNLFSLDEKVALVTGSSQGLGFAMAKGLAEAGARVASGAGFEIAVRPLTACL